MSTQLEFAFPETVTPGDTATALHDGFVITATVYADDDAQAPWERDDGHGAVTDWTRRAKEPGELVLAQRGEERRFYDFAGACKLALADGWGAKGDDGMAPRQKAAHAARADYERLKAWCGDGWAYVGIAVAVTRDGVALTGECDHALWGIEDDSGAADFAQVANDLAGPALDAARAKLAQLAPERRQLIPTWNATAAIIAAGLEHGTDEGRRLARAELAHMAALLDRAGPLLGRCADFLAGFEDDATQPSAAALLADLRAMLGDKREGGDVLAYLRRALPGVEVADPDDVEAMADMPLDSTCGEGCKGAIDAAAALAAQIRAAHGDHRRDLLADVYAAAVNVCAVFIRG